MNLLFELGTYLVMPFWALAILAPYWRITKRVMASPLIAVGPALIYVALFLPRIGEVLPVVSNPDLVSVMTLLGTPEGATLAWQHFLAFDLLVARWIHGDALEAGVNPWLLRVVLPITLLVGPVGYVLYLGASRGFKP